mgnify:CR=1 FL=1
MQRTVEDFDKCGAKASNGYNFPFISDCVWSDFNGKPCVVTCWCGRGGSFVVGETLLIMDLLRMTSLVGPCDDSAYPVPCGDGTCHSDYISCLRALTAMKKRKAKEDGGASELSQAMQEILKSSEWAYDENGLNFLDHE